MIENCFICGKEVLKGFRKWNDDAEDFVFFHKKCYWNYVNDKTIKRVNKRIGKRVNIFGVCKHEKGFDWIRDTEGLWKKCVECGKKWQVKE